MGQERDMDLTNTIEIQFNDSRITCVGSVELNDDQEYVGADEEAITERTRDVTINVVEDGRVYHDNGVDDLEPGTYLVNDRGLWRRIEFEAE